MGVVFAVRCMPLKIAQLVEPEEVAILRTLDLLLGQKGFPILQAIVESLCGVILSCVIPFRDRIYKYPSDCWLVAPILNVGDVDVLSGELLSFTKREYLTMFEDFFASWFHN